MCFRNDFLKHKSDIAKQALNSRSGRPIPVKDIEQYQQLEQKKDHEVMLVRMADKKYFEVFFDVFISWRFC